MEQELSEIVKNVKIKVQDLTLVSTEKQLKNESLRKRELENKKLVALVSLLTNKLLRFEEIITS